jgi:DNA polymerase
LPYGLRDFIATSVENLSEDEIFSLLLQEVELLEAECEGALQFDCESAVGMLKRIDSRSTKVAAHVQIVDCDEKPIYGAEQQCGSSFDSCDNSGFDVCNSSTMICAYDPAECCVSSVAKPCSLRNAEAESIDMDQTSNNCSASVETNLYGHPCTSNVFSSEEFSLPIGDKQTRWQALRKIVMGSPICNAHTKKGKKIVFGVGNLDADIFFCGEAPGADEETVGEPFVGRAGQLLTKIIHAMGISRDDVYIGNILNWRPEMPTQFGNRPPTAAEIQLCLPFLRAQVEIVSPKVIVALGNTAVNGLLGYDSKRTLGSVRGRWQMFDGIALMPTYHPSFLMREPTKDAKRKVWEDMLLVMEKVSLPISDKQRRCFL